VVIISRYPLQHWRPLPRSNYVSVERGRVHADRLTGDPLTRRKFDAADAELSI